MLGTPLAAPVAAVGPGRSVVVLAGQRLPGEPLGLVAAQLEHVRALRIDRDAAVEAVAAEVGERAARADVRLERVEQLGVAYSGCAPVITVRCPASAATPSACRS